MNRIGSLRESLCFVNEEDDTSRPKPDDIARLRAQAEQRFVIRCVGCNREIAKSAAEDAGWQPASAEPLRTHRCPECAEQAKTQVATCTSCGSQVAMSATAAFGWGHWPDKTGEQHLYCAACAIDLLDQQRKI